MREITVAEYNEARAAAVLRGYVRRPGRYLPRPMFMRECDLLSGVDASMSAHEIQAIFRDLTRAVMEERWEAYQAWRAEHPDAPVPSLRELQAWQAGQAEHGPESLQDSTRSSESRADSAEKGPDLGSPSNTRVLPFRRPENPVRASRPSNPVGRRP